MQRTLGVKGFEILGFALTVSHHSPTNGREASCKSHDHGAHFQTHNLSLAFTSFRTKLGPTKENQIVQVELVAGVPMMQTFTLDPTSQKPSGNNAFCQFPGAIGFRQLEGDTQCRQGELHRNRKSQFHRRAGGGQCWTLGFHCFPVCSFAKQGKLARTL